MLKLFISQKEVESKFYILKKMYQNIGNIIKQTVVYEYMVSYDSRGNYVNSVLSGQFRFSYSLYDKEMIQDNSGEFMRLTTQIKDYNNMIQVEDWEIEISYSRYMLTPSLHFQQKLFKENEPSPSF